MIDFEDFEVGPISALTIGEVSGLILVDVVPPPDDPIIATTQIIDLGGIQGKVLELRFEDRLSVEWSTPTTDFFSYDISFPNNSSQFFTQVFEGSFSSFQFGEGFYLRFDNILLNGVPEPPPSAATTTWGAFALMLIGYLAYSRHRYAA